MDGECDTRGRDELNPNCTVFLNSQICSDDLQQSCCENKWELEATAGAEVCWLWMGTLPLVLSTLRIAVGLPEARGALLLMWTESPKSVMQNQTCCEPSHRRLKRAELFREWSSVLPSCFIASYSHFQTIMPELIAHSHSWVSMVLNELPHHQWSYFHSEIRGGVTLWEIKLKVFHSHSKRTCWGHQDFVNTAIDDAPMCCNSWFEDVYQVTEWWICVELGPKVLWVKSYMMGH